MNTLTAELLESFGFGEQYVEDFGMIFPNGIPVTPESIASLEKHNLHTTAYASMLPPHLYIEYSDRTAPARKREIQARQNAQSLASTNYAAYYNASDAAFRQFWREASGVIADVLSRM